MKLSFIEVYIYSLDAEDQITAVAQLKSEGNTVISVKAGSKLNTEIKFGSGKKVKVRDLSAFCRQFNSLLKAGVGVITALDMLGDQTENMTTPLLFSPYIMSGTECRRVIPLLTQ